MHILYIEPYLYGAKHIYFAATGILNQLNIEILPENTSNKSRINMRYEIHRLSSTAQLCYAEYKGSFSTATLFGGLNYNAKLINNITQSNITDSLLILVESPEAEALVGRY